MIITELPFNQLIGLQYSDRPDALLSLPGDQRYTNHLGTVHASALLALAEATSGEYLIREIGNPGFGIIPVVRKMESKFRKPAFGEIYSKVQVGIETRDLFMTNLHKKGRALISIAVDIFDEKDTHTLNAIVEWFVSSKN